MKKRLKCWYFFIKNRVDPNVSFALLHYQEVEVYYPDSKRKECSEFDSCVIANSHWRCVNNINTFMFSSKFWYKLGNIVLSYPISSFKKFKRWTNLSFYFMNADIKLYHINKLVKKRSCSTIYYLSNDNTFMSPS